MIDSYHGDDDYSTYKYIPYDSTDGTIYYGPKRIYDQYKTYNPPPPPASWETDKAALKEKLRTAELDKEFWKKKYEEADKALDEQKVFNKIATDDRNRVNIEKAALIDAMLTRIFTSTLSTISSSVCFDDLNNMEMRVGNLQEEIKSHITQTYDLAYYFTSHRHTSNGAVIANWFSDFFKYLSIEVALLVGAGKTINELLAQLPPSPPNVSEEIRFSLNQVACWLTNPLNYTAEQVAKREAAAIVSSILHAIKLHLDNVRTTNTTNSSSGQADQPGASIPSDQTVTEQARDSNSL